MTWAEVVSRVRRSPWRFVLAPIAFAVVWLPPQVPHWVARIDDPGLVSLSIVAVVVPVVVGWERSLTRSCLDLAELVDINDQIVRCVNNYIEASLEHEAATAALERALSPDESVSIDK